jgi:hypothetical protein
MIQDIPDPWTYSVPTCLSQNLSDYRKCAYARSSGFGRSMGKREAIAAKAAGASLINLSDAICPGTGACPAVLNGMITFRDQHHLTAIFSASLAPALDQKLVAVLNATATPPPPSPS